MRQLRGSGNEEKLRKNVGERGCGPCFSEKTTVYKSVRLNYGRDDAARLGFRRTIYGVGDEKKKNRWRFVGCNSY